MRLSLAWLASRNSQMKQVDCGVWVCMSVYMGVPMQEVCVCVWVLVFMCLCELVPMGTCACVC